MSGRPRGGIARLQHDKRTSAQFKQTGSEIEADERERLQTQLSTLRAALTNFARDYGREIRQNAEFRGKFSQMCAAVGVDTLALCRSARDELARAEGGSAGAAGNSGSSEVGEVAEFYIELAICLVNVARDTRDANGGLIDIEQLVQLLNERQRRVSGPEISIEDVYAALRALDPLQPGYETLTIGGRPMLRTVPLPLSGDQQSVINAAGAVGFITVSMITDNLNWSYARAKAAIDGAVRAGIFWVDAQADEREYWLLFFDDQREILQSSVTKDPI